MAFVKNKRLYVLTDNKQGYEQFLTVLNEEFLTADRSNIFSYKGYCRAISSPVSHKVTRVFLLNNDETIRSDISEFLIGGKISINQNSGIRKSGNISLYNYNNMFTPNVVNGILWEGHKIRIDTGIYFNKNVYWFQNGIFVLHDPSENHEDHSVSCSIYDKFAMLDGTVSGKRDSEFKIPVGTPIKTAIMLCLNPDNNTDLAYDSKTVIFPSKYIDQTTPYTITKDPNCTMGEIIVELAKMISCDAFYNESGNLVIYPDSDNVEIETSPIQWVYKKEDSLTGKPSMDYSFANIAKRVTVFGAIENGYQYKGVFENTNPITKDYTRNLYFVSDDNIIGDQLCLDRAKYEYKKNCRLNIQLKFQSVYIPHLLPNDVVLWSSEDLNFNNDKFIINSIEFDLVNEGMSNLSLTYLEGMKI